MEIPLKAKYSDPKRTGSYKSKHNDNTKRRSTPKRKLSDKAKLDQQATQPLVVLHVLPSGKKRFVKTRRSDDVA